ncbi:MAG: chemotaxis-specific protein-glutamate methyltransferase CheB [Pseudomonadota bacterium]
MTGQNPHQPADRRSPIKVLIVEDSAVSRTLLIHILNADPAIRVIGAVASGEEALEAVARERPDLITMDVQLPGMNGFETTRAIMETHPVPIIIVTATCDMRQLETSFQAIDAGALAVLEKPILVGNRDYDQKRKELLTKVKLMSEIKVVRRWTRVGSKAVQAKRELGPDMADRHHPVNIVAIGASTGGPPVIEKILSELPQNFTPPVLIVQHMAEGFIHGFVEWLGQSSTLPVHVALHGSVARSGHVYVAPDGLQMKVELSGRICCTDDGPENGLRPAISYLFRSVAEVYGKNAIGVLLTGMGKDGAGELKLMREKGAVTVAQNEETSAVFGMPGEAVRLEAARYVLPSDKIAAVLTSLAMIKAKKTTDSSEKEYGYGYGK